MIGENPPAHVMEGFLRRVWKTCKIDKVAIMKKGIFVVQFQAMNSRDTVLAGC